jgi:hypothetical protein
METPPRKADCVNELVGGIHRKAEGQKQRRLFPEPARKRRRSHVFT